MQSENQTLKRYIHEMKTQKANTHFTKMPLEFFPYRWKYIVTTATATKGKQQQQQQQRIEIKTVKMYLSEPKIE